MLDFNVFYRLAAAIGIGLIIGLQREHTYFDQSDRHPAGVRTFTLVGLAGAMAALLSDQMGGVAPFVAGFVVMALLLFASHICPGQARRGWTSYGEKWNYDKRCRYYRVSVGRNLLVWPLA